MNYVDGYLIPIPKKNVAAYKRMAAVGCKVWMDHGALAYCEAVGDDLVNKKMPMNFKKQLKLKPTETAVFAWIVYKSKADRNRVNKAVMKDPRLGAMMKMKEMPFDFKKMCFGGFKALVEA